MESKVDDPRFVQHFAVHKVTEARNRFPKLAPDIVAAKCPFFREMLDDLESRVRTARGLDAETLP